MKRVLTWIGRGVAVVVAIVAAFLAYVAVSGIPRYPAPKLELHVASTPERVARGKRFVTILCGDCHKNPETRQLTGKLMADAPPEFGRIYSKNITNHPTAGIGSRTDGEIAVLLRTGVRWDGQFIPPYMARLPLLSDDDLESIIAFLRSSDDLVRANDAPADPVQPGFLTKLLSHVAWQPLPLPSGRITAPPTTDKVAYGRYLIDGLECYSCHSADFKTMDNLAPEKSGGYLGGGNQMRQMNGVAIFTSNLTSDEETGIGRWSEAQFEHALRDGFRPDGTMLRPPMVRASELTHDEVDAIYAYLRSVPKLHNAVSPPPPDPDYANHSAGSVAYHAYGCVKCHGETGMAYGNLRPGKAKYATNEAMIAFLDDPSAVIPDTKMPAWKGIIKPADYEPLCDYVRSLAK